MVTLRPISRGSDVEVSISRLSLAMTRLSGLGNTHSPLETLIL
jgi:hypothetical protein